MALHWRPVGPEPAATYWLRRAVVATGAVLVLALLVAALPGGDDGPERLAAAPEATATTAPGAPPGAPPSAPPAPTPNPNPTAVAICQPEVLTVEAVAGADSYPVGASPKLSLRVTNTGTAPCTRDLGQAAIELLVFSGRDRIWSSDDCAPGGPKQVTTLKPGETVTRRATWNGRRSLPGCAGSKAQAQAGTYRVTARVGQLRDEGDAFRLTG